MNTTIDLKNKTIVITGASQGIGEDIARYCAQSGAAGLCLTGRNSQRGEKIARELTGEGCPTLFIEAHLEKPDDCRSIMGSALERFKRVDGLVNAAGLTDRGTIEDTSIELWDRLFAVNVRAPFILSQELVRYLKKEKRPGSIVNIITMSSHGGQPFLTAYASSKGALATLTKNNAHALRFDRIRVNGINIGWTDTPGEHAIQKRDGNPADWLQKAEASQPFQRLIKPKDVSFLTSYLLSDKSEMMTGALIDFDQNVIGAYS